MQAVCVGAEVSIPGPKPLYICAVGVIQTAVAANKNHTSDFNSLHQCPHFTISINQKKKDKRHLSSTSSLQACFDV